MVPALSSAFDSKVTLLGHVTARFTWVYGTRAVGTQLADMTGRTIRFDLSFDFEKVKRAEEVWKRLQVFSTSYSDLLDRIA